MDSLEPCCCCYWKPYYTDFSAAITFVAAAIIFDLIRLTTLTILMIRQGVLKYEIVFVFDTNRSGTTAARN
jgi:hypothetical protein